MKKQVHYDILTVSLINCVHIVPFTFYLSAGIYCARDMEFQCYKSVLRIEIYPLDSSKRNVFSGMIKTFINDDINI